MDGRINSFGRKEHKGEQDPEDSEAREEGAGIEIQLKPVIPPFPEKGQEGQDSQVLEEGLEGCDAVRIPEAATIRDVPLSSEKEDKLEGKEKDESKAGTKGGLELKAQQEECCEAEFDPDNPTGEDPGRVPSDPPGLDDRELEGLDRPELSDRGIEEERGKEDADPEG